MEEAEGRPAVQTQGPNKKYRTIILRIHKGEKTEPILVRTMFSVFIYMGRLTSGWYSR